MTVVPDNYVGPMPAGAVSESDYQRMAKVYGNIESGHSSLTFDTSGFFKDKDGGSYSGMRWDGPDTWGQQKDAEEPPRKSPYR